MATMNVASVFVLNNASSHSPPFSYPSLPLKGFMPKYHPFNNLNILRPTSHHQVTTHALLASDEQSSNVAHFTQDLSARKGREILAEALQREGVRHVFGYPGHASMDILDALKHCTRIRNVLARHEQGSILAAEGYARASGFPGVCITTSGPGATNVVSGLANAYQDSIPLVVITGQIHTKLMGTGDLQDIRVVDITRPITKCNYSVSHVDEIARIIKEAFYVAKTGKPGPVLVDVPLDIMQHETVPDWDEPMQLDDYLSSLPKPPCETSLEKIVDMIGESKRPVLYIGGGCSDSADELRRFVEMTGIPVASTMTGLGIYPCTDEEHSLQMLGWYGTDRANYAVRKCDLLLAFGTRFTGYATGKIETFATESKIVHIDIDPAEIGKNKQVTFSLCADIKLALQGMNAILGRQEKREFSTWRKEIDGQSRTSDNYPIMYSPNPNGDFKDAIHPWDVLLVLDEMTQGNAIICTGAGWHQLYATQFYNHKHPRHFLTPAGFGVMGFGLPASIGACIAKPDSMVVDVDGDGSFIMNVQELATARCENLPLKIVILNNQHLGSVATWEDEFSSSNRGHSFLGNPSKPSKQFPDMVKFGQACDIPGARVAMKTSLRGAMQKMLDTPGPYLLDVIMPVDHAIPTLTDI